MKRSRTLATVLAAGVLGGLCVARAAGAQPVVIETVPVGNPGNAADQPRLQCCNDPSAYGSVAYAYRIARYEVTAGQYTAFLNAVAASDPEGLYHVRMDYDADPSRAGCNIERHGVPGSYTYTVAPDWAERPVNYVSWADAARFANWLHNGQPTGAQDPTTTEDGAYSLHGIDENDDEGLEDVVRKPGATWAIASEDEWYKAAYHRNDGVTGSYWNYPTGTNGVVSNQLVDPDPGNNATFGSGATIGAPYFRTEVGAHENSESPYGTFDQGGNVMEFTEAVPEPDIRRIRGGSWFWGPILAKWDFDDVMHSSDQFNDLGFRVVRLLPDAACSDGLDNDGDGLVDLDDPGCADGNDLDERSPALACDDGADNDGDGRVDLDDPGCPAPGSTPENPPCDDGIDNDGDGFVDFADPHCTLARPHREAPGGCGLGAGLALVIPLLGAAAKRRRRAS
jgi:formylglycine-generating enzyme required for sulfatase activity